MVLGSFMDHEGFDGVMLGIPGASYHLDFRIDSGGADRPARLSVDYWFSRRRLRKQG
jgi:hypothetical protein